MGYRHIVISHTLIEEPAPEWLREKYEGVIDFSGQYWRSYGEYKRYGVLSDFNIDVQKYLIESNFIYEFVLIYYADESPNHDPDIIFTVITRAAITERHPTEWQDQKLSHHY